ncbi:hypothetical protein ACFL6G_00555 [candidate division KSB1 bacterium]
MEIRTACPECGKKFKIPKDYSKKKGRCPSCRALIDIESLKQIPQKSDFNNKHPVIYLTEKYSTSLSRYGADLQKIYKLIRNQLVHKKDYEEQKKILREQTFSPIIDEMSEFQKFELNPETRIELWKLVFTILPFSYPDKDESIVFNLYPRYEYATVICCGYVLSGYEDKQNIKKLIIKAVHGEINSKAMKNLIKKVVDSSFGEKFTNRSKTLLKETRDIPEIDGVNTHQIREDFNFGFSWISFHLPDL